MRNKFRNLITGENYCLTKTNPPVCSHPLSTCNIEITKVKPTLSSPRVVHVLDPTLLPYLSRIQPRIATTSFFRVLPGQRSYYNPIKRKTTKKKKKTSLPLIPLHLYIPLDSLLKGYSFSCITYFLSLSLSLSLSPFLYL